MAEIKTKKQNSGIKEFIAGIPDKAVRKDCQTLADLMAKVTGDSGDMWGSSIVGFGTYRIRYADGHEADWLSVGFSPRKANLSLYIINGFNDTQDLLAKLGPHSLGKGCLYVKRLSDIDLTVLEQLLRKAFKFKSNT